MSLNDLEQLMRSISAVAKLLVFSFHIHMQWRMHGKLSVIQHVVGFKQLRCNNILISVFCCTDISTSFRCL